MGLSHLIFNLINSGNIQTIHYLNYRQGSLMIGLILKIIMKAIWKLIIFLNEMK